MLGTLLDFGQLAVLEDLPETDLIARGEWGLLQLGLEVVHEEGF